MKMEKKIEKLRSDLMKVIDKKVVMGASPAAIVDSDQNNPVSFDSSSKIRTPEP